MLNGPDLHTISLQPLGADARCRNVTASFDDGTSVNAPINGGEPMREGDLYHMPINGAGRGLNALGLTCEAQNGESVVIRIYGET